MRIKIANEIDDTAKYMYMKMIGKLFHDMGSQASHELHCYIYLQKMKVLSVICNIFVHYLHCFEAIMFIKNDSISQQMIEQNVQLWN